jgi:hypothetical protein
MLVIGVRERGGVAGFQFLIEKASLRESCLANGGLATHHVS